MEIVTTTTQIREHKMNPGRGSLVVSVYFGEEKIGEVVVASGPLADIRALDAGDLTLEDIRRLWGRVKF
jgi:hypothetical protein